MSLIKWPASVYDKCTAAKILFFRPLGFDDHREKMWKHLPPADAAWQGGRIYPSAAAAAAAALPGVKLGGGALGLFCFFIYLSILEGITSINANALSAKLTRLAETPALSTSSCSPTGAGP